MKVLVMVQCDVCWRRGEVGPASGMALWELICGPAGRPPDRLGSAGFLHLRLSRSPPTRVSGAFGGRAGWGAGEKGQDLGWKGIVRWTKEWIYLGDGKAPKVLLKRTHGHTHLGGGGGAAASIGHPVLGSRFRAQILKEPRVPLLYFIASLLLNRPSS